MSAEIHCTIRQYRRDVDLPHFLDAHDRIFSSPRGIFIARGIHSTHSPHTIREALAQIKTDGTNDVKPFAVFALDFDRPAQEQEIVLPEEMIFIDEHDWVTHFSLSQSENQLQDTHEIEHPHHIELMSPESKDQFIDKVNQVLKHIEVGDVQKVVISRRLDVTADIEIDIRLVFDELLDSQPDSFVYICDGFVGASPELLVEKFSRTIRCVPMAGTRKRHARIDDDDADIADLQTNAKDSVEHRVVVDDIVSSLSRIATNVTSSVSPHVVRLPHVAHLATSITATVSSDTDLMSLVTQLHPTPAVAGVPKDKALEIIVDLEGYDRSKYGAPVGYIDADGNGQSAIALRCARILGTHAQLYAGVGVVKGSDPDMEWDETQAKFGVIRDALMNITQ